MEALVLSILGLIIGWHISKWSSIEDSSTSICNVDWKTRRALEVDEDKNLQIIEDLKYEANISKNAQDRLEWWLKSQEMQKLNPDSPWLWGAHIFNPLKYGGFYHIYHEETAKYKSTKLSELVDKEFERLKKLYDYKH